MLKIYEINQEFRVAQALMEEWAAEHDGDITSFPLAEELDKLQCDKEHKLLSMGCIVLDYEAEATALKEQAKKLAERARVAEAKADRLRDYITSSLEPTQKLKDARVSLGFRKSESVEIEGEAYELPLEFQRAKIEADKTSIKEALKAGKVIPQARLVTRYSLQVK